MAFPATTPTSQQQASALLSNNASNAGLTNTVPLDRLANLEQVVGNLLTDLPSTMTTIQASGAIPLGYTTGAGGTVTQSTNKSTGVTLNKVTGAITMNNAALADATTVSFTVTNSTVAATDTVVAIHASAGTAGAYVVQANAIAGGSFAISVRNVSGGSLGEAIVIRFTVFKSVSA